MHLPSVLLNSSKERAVLILNNRLLLAAAGGMLFAIGSANVPATAAITVGKVSGRYSSTGAISRLHELEPDCLPLA